MSNATTARSTVDATARPRRLLTVVGSVALVVAGVAGCGSSHHSPASASSSGTAGASAPRSSGAVAGSVTVCGGGAGAGAAASPFAVPSASPSGDPAAVRLYEQAMSAFAEAGSVHVTGVIGGGAQPMTVDLSYCGSSGSKGTIKVAGGTLSFVALPSATYIKLDTAALRALGGRALNGVPDSELSAVAGKWLKIDKAARNAPGDPFAGLTSVTDLSRFAADFVPSGSLSLRPATTTVDGQQATVITESGGGSSQAGALYVQADGQHLPLEATQGSSSGAATATSTAAASTATEVKFGDYGKAVELKVPSGAIDVLQLLSLFGGASGSAASSPPS